MRDLNFELKQMCRRNRDGSYATQRDRERVLDLVAGQLQELGFRQMTVTSLKPKHVNQLRRFEHQCAAAGVHRIHGHRHQYAQVRYRELTAWAAPAAGGPRSKDLTPEQRELNREARLTISAELGHEREQITAVYLGR